MNAVQLKREKFFHLLRMNNNDSKNLIDFSAFSKNTGQILKKFHLNDQAKYSISRPYEAEQISKYILEGLRELGLNSRTCTITDGTAGVGGDAITFSKYFKTVNAVEYDIDTKLLLENNCKEFNCNNINVFYRDYTKIMTELEQDVIYIDPPWGGINYRDNHKVNLKISDKTLKDIIIILKKIKNINPPPGFSDKNIITKLLYIKVPMNINLDNISEFIDDKIQIENKKRSPSFLIIKIKI